MRDEVVVVAPSADAHAKAVVDRLRATGTTTHHLDLARFPGDWPTTVALGSRETLVIGSACLDLVRSVWLRRVHPPTGSGSGADLAYSASNLACLLYGVAGAAPHVRWVNPLGTLLTQDGGAGKLEQLRTAQRYGLAIPDTLATTDHQRAVEFTQRHQRTIFKPFRSVRGREIYTTELSGPQNWTALARSPGILQELIPKAYEVRVVTCGGEHLATEIHSQEKGATVDFRHDTSVTHRPHVLPDEVAWRLASLLADCDLAMGMSDLIVRPDGTYVYLETNPQGQWLWLQERTGQDYVGFVANFLASAS
jgi:hypothetical protein